MFKILNQATDQEIAIITAVIDSLKNKSIETKKEINHWQLSAKINICEKDTWKSKTFSTWQSESKKF